MPYQPQPIRIACTSAGGNRPPMGLPPQVLTASGSQAGSTVMLSYALPLNVSAPANPLQQWLAVAQVTGGMSGIAFVNPSSNLAIAFNGANNPLVLQPFTLGGAVLALWAVAIPPAPGNGWTAAWPLTISTPDGGFFWALETLTSALPTQVLTAAPSAVAPAAAANVPPPVAAPVVTVATGSPAPSAGPSAAPPAAPAGWQFLAIA